jgi:hypothetical protein
MPPVSKETKKEVGQLLKRLARTSSAKESQKIADEIEKKVTEAQGK